MTRAFARDLWLVFNHRVTSVVNLCHFVASRRGSGEPRLCMPCAGTRPCMQVDCSLGSPNLANGLSDVHNSFTLQR